MVAVEMLRIATTDAIHNTFEPRGLLDYFNGNWTERSTPSNLVQKVALFYH